jgi:hypothetical protein
VLLLIELKLALLLSAQTKLPVCVAIARLPAAKEYLPNVKFPLPPGIAE